MNPLWQLTLARFREFYREPAAIFWVYGFPLILATTLGAAFREKPVPPSVVDVQEDAADPQASERLKQSLTDERLVVEVHSEADCRKRLRTSKSDIVVVPRPGTPPGYEFVFDKTRSESVLARNAVDGVLLRSAKPDVPAPSELLVVEPGGRYIDFLIPGLLGINLLGGGLFGVGFVSADMRVRKLLKRFQATPMRRSDFLLSLVISRLAFTLVEVSLLLGFAYIVFDIRVRGNVLALFALIAAGGLSFAGVGLLVGCRARTMETISGLVNAVMLPMYVFSGVFFSASRFPEEIQPIIRILPLTALNDGLREVMNEGAGWGALVYPIAILAAWGGLSFALALRFFRWR